jgi:hypothetical protein
MENPLLLHDGYLQCKRELAQLCGHINWKWLEGSSDASCGDGNTDGPCSFYRHFFADKVQVSYLGYSLGGDTVLCDFLDSEESLNACFLLNPAINIPGVERSQLVGRATWEEYVPNFLGAIRDYPEKDRMFEEVVIGQYKSESTRLLKKHGQRLLFILGGKDNFTKYTNAQTIMPENWGSGMFIIPGIDHLVAESEEWKKWRMLVVKLISDFEENAARRVITKKKLDEIRKGVAQRFPKVNVVKETKNSTGPRCY